MTLFQKIQELIGLGYIVSFSPEILNVKISLEVTIMDEYICKESMLPMSDHFYESKVVDCIDFMYKQIQAETH